MKTFELLGEIDFGKIVAEAIANNKTQTGRELLEKYSAYCMKSAATCGVINAFVMRQRIIFMIPRYARLIISLQKS